MAQFLYNPYGKEHGWQARVDTYTQKKSSKSQAEQLAWLRRQWQENPALRQNLLCLAKQVKIYGRKAWRAGTAAYPVEANVVRQAVYGIIRKGIV